MMADFKNALDQGVVTGVEMSSRGATSDFDAVFEIEANEGGTQSSSQVYRDDIDEGTVGTGGSGNSVNIETNAAYASNIFTHFAVTDTDARNVMVGDITVTETYVAADGASIGVTFDYMSADDQSITFETTYRVQYDNIIELTNSYETLPVYVYAGYDMGMVKQALNNAVLGNPLWDGISFDIFGASEMGIATLTPVDRGDSITGATLAYLKPTVINVAGKNIEETCDIIENFGGLSLSATVSYDATGHYGYLTLTNNIGNGDTCRKYEITQADIFTSSTTIWAADNSGSQSDISDKAIQAKDNLTLTVTWDGNKASDEEFHLNGSNNTERDSTVVPPVIPDEVYDPVVLFRDSAFGGLYFDEFTLKNSSRWTEGDRFTLALTASGQDDPTIDEITLFSDQRGTAMPMGYRFYDGVLDNSAVDLGIYQLANNIAKPDSDHFAKDQVMDGVLSLSFGELHPTGVNTVRNAAGFQSVFQRDMDASVAHYYSRLEDIKQFWDSNGVFILENNDQLLTIRQKEREIKIMIGSGEELGKLAEYLSERIWTDLLMQYDGVPRGNAATLQIGATQGEDMTLTLGAVTAKALGIENIDVRGRDAASRGVTRLDNAIKRVSRQRAIVGAQINRLDHAISGLSVASQNLTESRSRIVDTDMAHEMAEFTKLNILSRASASMLAQANVLPQNILPLLR